MLRKMTVDVFIDFRDFSGWIYKQMLHISLTVRLLLIKRYTNIL